MAFEADSTELASAKRAIVAARQKMADHIGSSNLNRSGLQKSLVAPTPHVRPKTAAALKREYGNGREKSVKEVEREVVGDSIKLHGKARAVPIAQGNVAQNKEALKLSPTLTVPIGSDSRATNKDGATSFHFKHETIAKTLTEKTSASGTKTRKNAGRDHAKYLERDSAVARNGESVDRASLSVGREEITDTLGRAAAGGVYIEREEALAYQQNGVPVIYSNISQDDARERQRLWDKIEEYETAPKPDFLNIITGQDLEFWEAVRTDPRCPEQLSLGILDADPAKPYRVETGDNEFVRQFMMDHGWAPPSPRKPDDSAADKSERERIDHDNSKGAECVDGRGGRIQNRIVGELPDEVSHEQRVRILRRFAAHFEEKKFPYVAVMHAPDYSNHKKNWHFHLVYYDRPCSRFSGDPEDYLKTRPEANWRAQAIHDLKAKAFASGALKKYVGQWDFTVPVTHITKCSHTRTSYPFAQDKDRECTKKNYPLKLRKMLAEFTNDELQLAGSGRRVDPRRFSEMGIDKEAEEHLGTRSAQMECLGIATPVGVENEHRQWRFALANIENSFKACERNRVNEERCWRQKLACYDLSPTGYSELSEMITRWARIQAEANEQAAIASELAHQLERVQSRANQVQETCKRHLTAIDQGRANKRQSDNKINYQARLTEATNHLSGLTIILAREIFQEERSRDEATKLAGEADNIRAVIDARLKEQLAAIVAAPVSAKGKEKEKPELLTDTEQAVQNHKGSVKVIPVLEHSEALPPLRQSDVERFMKHLVDNNRRLTKEGSYVIPVNPDDYEMGVISTPNYADHQHRLCKLKAAQDAHIDRLSHYILANPNVIEVVQGRAGVDHIRYKLMSDDEILQHAFKGFGADDYLIKAAIETTLKARQDGGIDVAPSPSANSPNRVLGALPAPVGPETTRKPAADLAGERRTRSSTLTAVMRKIDDVAAAVKPIIRETRDGAIFYCLAEQDLRATGLTNEELRAAPVQTRLRGIHQQQESEINRLVGFIRLSPARAITSTPTLHLDNRQVVGLARNVPPDLLALSQKYAHHPFAQKQLSDALRQAAAEPRRTNVAEPRPVTRVPELPLAGLKPEVTKGEAPNVEWEDAAPSAPATRRPNAGSTDGINLTKPSKAPAQLDVHELTLNDETNKAAGTSPPATPEGNGTAAGAMKDQLGKTKEQCDEVLRRWKGEEDAAPLAHIEPDYDQVISNRLDTLEKRLIRFVVHDDYVLPASRTALTGAEAMLVRDRQVDCRAIKDRQDKQIEEASDFLLAHNDKIAAFYPLAYPPRVQDAITAWPEDTAIAAHSELIKVNRDILQTEALERQYELMRQAAHMQRSVLKIGGK